jgi:biopolymer transport protein ExbD
MLKRPSHRRRSRGTEVAELPLVPIMDAFVTLIAFLLLATSLLAVTLIDTPVPVVSNVPDESKEKPLMLTLKITPEELNLGSAFDRIPVQKFPKVDKGYDLEKLHEALVALRTQFPAEKTLVFMPTGDIKYDDIIQIMDSARILLKTDPPFFVTEEKPGSTPGETVKVDKPDPYLFPNVVFGNILSGN